MVKRITQVLVVIMLALMLLTPKIIAFDVHGQTEYVVNSYEQGFFCMNHGLILNYGTRFFVYERGPVSNLASSFQHSTHAGLDGAGDNGQLLSFIVGDMAKAALTDSSINGNLGTGGRSSQEWALYVWYLLDPIHYTSVSPSEFASLEERYNAYINIYNQAMGSSATSAVTIESPDPNIVVPDSTGKVGPFTIKYPYDDKMKDSIEYKITVNDTNVVYNQDATASVNKLLRADGTPFQIGDTECYIPISELTYGVKNKFHVDWSFKYYKEGYYAKLTPLREVYYEYMCTDCRATLRTTATGYLIGGTWHEVTSESFNKYSPITSVHDSGWTHSTPWSIDSFEDGNYYLPNEEDYDAGIIRRITCS